METVAPSTSLLEGECPKVLPDFNPANKAIASLYAELPTRLVKLIHLFATMEDDGIADSIPKWHATAIRGFARIIFPTLSSKSAAISASGREGRFVGHSLAIFCEFNSSVEFRSHFSPDIIASLKELADSLKPFAEIFMNEVTARPRHEVADFFEGVAYAMPRTILKDGWFYGWTDAALLYFFVALAPDVVGKFERLSDFHDFLCSSMNRKWDVERTKKFCTRIGLRFRQKGRPRKNKGTA